MERISKFVIYSLSLLLVACQSMAPKLQVAADPGFSKFLRGTVYLESSSYKFRACGSTSFSTLTDDQGLLAEFFRAQDSAVLSKYVEFDASADQALDFKLNKIHFVANTPVGCSHKVESAKYYISAVDDRWNAVINEKELLISKKDIYTQLTFAADSTASHQWQGSIVLARGIKYDMKMRLFDKECLDNQGNWYRLSAKMSLNNVEYLGCARKSLLINDFVSAKYTNALAETDAFIVLNLEKDKKAKLIIDYRNGYPILVSQGQWRINSNQNLELLLAVDEVTKEQSVMLFEVFNNHELRLKAFSDILGNKGLKLLPINKH